MKNNFKKILKTNVSPGGFSQRDGGAEEEMEEEEQDKTKIICSFDSKTLWYDFSFRINESSLNQPKKKKAKMDTEKANLEDLALKLLTG